MSEPYIGEIRMFGGNFAPRNWALCNGQLMSISQNSALFSILGTVYGGDGHTTFGLPNFQGSVPVHAGTLPGGGTYVLGEKAGVESVTLLSAQMPQHTHTATFGSGSATLLASPNGADAATPTGNYLANASDAGGQAGSSFATPGNAGQTGALAGLSLNLNGLQIGLAGQNGAHENRPPFLVVNFIIALMGIYPTRN